MKKIFFFLILSLSFERNINAQVTLQPSIPTIGLLQKDQLWYIMVINNNNKQYECKFELTLLDRKTGLEILTAISGQISIPAGVKQLNVNVLNPIQYNYFVSGIDNRFQSLIPVGSYTACYTLTDIINKDNGKLSEECIQFDIEPLSPPMLIFPSDSALLENAPVQFSWIPPTPAGMFNHLSYELIISEINNGQKAEEAIQQNIPFYSDAAIKNNFSNYPATAIAFERDKWYSWQVIARDEQNYVGKSESWVFKVSPPKATPPKNENPNYISLNSVSQEQGIHVIDDNRLNIKYYSFDKEYTTKINFFTADNDMVYSMKQKIIYGDNFFNLKISNQFNVGQIYKIEIIDLKGNSHIALFRMNKK